MSTRGRERGRTQQGLAKKRIRIESIAEDTDKMEYIPPVDTTRLLERVRAAIYLSLDELQSVPSDNALIATFLDLRFKHFNWAANGERDKAYQLVKTLYDALKVNLHISDDIDDRNQDDDDDGDFFRELEGDDT